MSFDFSAKFNANIDKTVLKQVSQEIMKRANANNADFNVNATNFKTPAETKQALGLNLYNGTVDVQVAKQIALNNSGLQIQLNQNVLDSIKYLNSQASVRNANDLGGRITINVNENIAQVVSPENPSVTQGILSFATDKDKSGSQTPYRGEFLQLTKNDDETIENIFERNI